MQKERVKRYSQSFKQQVVKEYEDGTSIYKLKQKYGIGGHLTIQRWVEKYSRTGYRSEVVRIQTVEDHLEVQAMKERITELESALSESVLENRMLKATIDTANEALDMDIKKNFGKKS